MRRFYHLSLVLLLLMLFSCNPSPKKVKYGKDICARCSMMIMDQRFGAEIVTKKGKVLTFDSAECMIKYFNSKKSEQENFEFIMVTDASKPQTLIHAQEAYYLKSDNFPSPMGENLSAFSSEQERQKFASEYSGNVLNWNELTLLLQ